MNVKYYPHLLTLLLVVAWLSFGSGCCWEEPIQVGDTMSSTTTGTVSQAVEILVVQCKDGEAHAFYPGQSRTELATIHALGHLLAQPADYLNRQTPAYITTGEVWVDCVAEGVDYVTFVHR